ncbi:MAG: GvpL/GvpF family gas vesicle protein [Candidatus Euphemobacter frigidus]|nr:GvpL/GvpF family gas vesicle protein [Candidatus Euphemobacter frigidus]MDP8274794.1 GvpL/GvpF family gas vesicle protein [Candidatus Euphemobacter frigidus]
MDEGKYLYCVINESNERNFGPIGIGGRGDEVHTLCFRDLACVISPTPMTKYVISRDNLIAQEKVLEEVMKEYDVLPFRFCTIAAGAEEIRSLLMKRYHELKNLLRDMDNKVELGLKVFWLDLSGIFREIGETDPRITSLKKKMAGKSSPPAVNEKVNLGKEVKQALEQKREAEAEEILDALRPRCVDLRVNKIAGENMVLNCAFLVDKAHEIEFDDLVEELSRKYEDRLKFKYVGPVAPFNFAELVIKWGQEQ